ncbi:hypothetical protein chiPu_0006345 [Chiloscyllium punctatum]|uniref:Uncharacterized protein n=1 Tax=Chiloscyllium punctatum TaxID=137246 RepID=A0A401SBY2_CHIPU|nr:hypothetical protein [Chiloscyllium punctatum]
MSVRLSPRPERLPLKAKSGSVELTESAEMESAKRFIWSRVFSSDSPCSLTCTCPELGPLLCGCLSTRGHDSNSFGQKGHR